METVQFLAILATFAAVLAWYLANAEAGSDGVKGLLALTDDPQTAKTGLKRRAYHMKSRLARRSGDLRETEAVKAQSAATPAFHRPDETDRMRRRFRRQDEARYAVKDRKRPTRPGGKPSAA